MAAAPTTTRLLDALFIQIYHPSSVKAHETVIAEFAREIAVSPSENAEVPIGDRLPIMAGRTLDTGNTQYRHMPD
jgi:hypothetical protein